MTIIAVLIVIVLIAIFGILQKVQDPLAGFNVTTFNGDIVIKRVDDKEPLNAATDIPWPYWLKDWYSEMKSPVSTFLP